MLRWLRERLAAQRQARLNRLIKLADKADTLIAFGRLSPETRQLLQTRRQVVQEQLRDLVCR